MTSGARPASTGAWVDANTPCSAATCAAVRAAGKVGIVRYVPLPNNKAGSGISAAELSAILAAGLECLLVQHVRSPAPGHTGWLPSLHSGHDDAVTATQWAAHCGYAPGAHIFLDFEDIADSPGAATAFAVDWQRTVIASGYRAGLYVGYAVPLHPLDLYQLPGFDSYWSDAGKRQVSTRGCAMHQGQPEVAIGGVKFDPDALAPDLLGDVPWSMSGTLPDDVG